MPNVAIFLDRDDTINYDTGYMNDPDQIKLLPGVAENIAKLKKIFNFKIIVISNQSGITRGLITENDVKIINNKINELLIKDSNTSIDKFYFCPFHPDFDDLEECECRKPSPKMIFAAATEFNIDLNKSYFIGDRISDIECGNNAGVKTVLLLTCSNVSDDEIILLKNTGKSPTFVARNFFEVFNFISNDYSGGIV